MNILSTLTTPNETASIQRKEKDGTQTTLDCPTAITTYNRYMAGVDKGDQLRQYYRLRMKFMKNYKYIFLLDVAITDSYILYSKFSPADKKQKLKDFRLSLAQELIGDYCGRMRIGRPCLLTTPHPQPLPYQPSHLPQKRMQKRKCAYCSGYRNPPCRRESRWYCGDCEGHPTLSHGNC